MCAVMYVGQGGECNKYNTWVSPNLPSLADVPAACTSSVFFCVFFCVLFILLHSVFVYFVQ